MSEKKPLPSTDKMFDLRAIALEFALVDNGHQQPEAIARRAKVFMEFMASGYAPGIPAQTVTGKKTKVTQLKKAK